METTKLNQEQEQLESAYMAIITACDNNDINEVKYKAKKLKTLAIGLLVDRERAYNEEIKKQK